MDKHSLPVTLESSLICESHVLDVTTSNLTAINILTSINIAINNPSKLTQKPYVTPFKHCLATIWRPNENSKLPCNGFSIIKGYDQDNKLFASAKSQISLPSKEGTAIAVCVMDRIQLTDHDGFLTYKVFFCADDNVENEIEYTKHRLYVRFNGS